MAHYRDTHYPLFQALINRLRPEILWHGFTRGDASWRHFHPDTPYNRLYLFLKGQAWVRHAADRSAQDFPDPEAIGSGWTLLSPGRAYLLPAGHCWQLWAKEAFEKFFVHFRLEVWPGRDLFQDAGETLPMKLDWPGVKALARSAAGGPADLLRFQSGMAQLLVSFLESARFPEGRPLENDLLLAQKYNAVFEAAEQTPFREWSFQTLAQRLGRSLPSLSRSFRRDTGMTLTDFFRLRLVRRAGDLLVLSDRSIREIASELGFEDEHYFSRFFRKASGVPPREWRKRNQEALGPRDG